MSYENDRGEEVTTKEEGEELWKKAMTLRFLEGGDKEVDYGGIDTNEDYDDWVVREREAQEEWFDAETPAVAEELVGGELRGETGVLDY